VAKHRKKKKKNRESVFLTLSILDDVGWHVALKIAKNRGNTNNNKKVYHYISTSDACREDQKVALVKYLP